MRSRAERMDWRRRWNTSAGGWGRTELQRLRRFIRTFARADQDSDVWPVVLLLFAVVVPAVCLLWFMSAAMRNERFAVRQKLAEAYRSQLSGSQARLERYW